MFFLKRDSRPDFYRGLDASLMFEVTGGVVRAAVEAVGAADGAGHRAAPEPFVGQLAAGLVIGTRFLEERSHKHCLFSP